VLRAPCWASGYLLLLRCCEQGHFGTREMRPRTDRKWLEISRNFDFRLTRHRTLDNIEKFAQKRHSLLSALESRS